MAINSRCDEIILPALREEFPRLREWLETIAAELAMPRRAMQQLLIAADEIFTNIALYAYPADTGSVTVAAKYVPNANAFQLHLSDTGIAFDPTAQQPPDTTVPLAERALGGLGITVVRKMMDRMEYERTGNRNHLTLTKCFTPETEVRK